jgi:pimeloyl-ACP methyl ester carboxylesterase
MDILLIAGLWLDASVWDEVAVQLRVRGHRAVPVTLSGQGDGNRSAVLADQVAAVVAAVDAADQAVVAGHSAACRLAWAAADARPGKISKVALIGGFPSAEGQAYFDSSFPVQDGAVPFPGWAEFEGPDSDEANSKNVSFIDIDSGHWPMISAPAELAGLLAQAAGHS